MNNVSVWQLGAAPKPQTMYSSRFSPLQFFTCDDSWKLSQITIASGKARCSRLVYSVDDDVERLLLLTYGFFGAAIMG